MSCMKGCLSKSSITTDKEAICKAMFWPCINLHSDASFKSIGTLHMLNHKVPMHFLNIQTNTCIVHKIMRQYKRKNKFVLDKKGPIHTKEPFSL